jgi:predicted Fe-Mo cluster-binding NifX family protein
LKASLFYKFLYLAYLNLEEITMKTIIPVDTEGGIDQPICTTIGGAAWFAKLNNDGTGQMIENLACGQSDGGCATVQIIDDLDVDAIIANEVGEHALIKFNARNIKIFSSIQGSVVDNYVALLKGELSEMKEGASCETPDDEAENCSH